MSAKQIDVTCPCCSARLTVDVLTRTILRSVTAEELGPDGAGGPRAGRWDAAARRASGRVRSGQDKLDEALEAERAKQDRLDDLFRKANEKLSKPDAEGR
jgi:hypothetical protein